MMWNALPLTEYCVDINTTTLDFTEIVALDSLCGFTNEYIFMYSDNSVCARFTVTPTDGEMRGTTSELCTGLFTRVEGVFMILIVLHFYNIIMQVVENNIVFLKLKGIN